MPGYIVWLSIQYVWQHELFLLLIRSSIINMIIWNTNDVLFFLQEQYTIVFEALLEAFTVPDTSIDKDHFCTYLENQQLNITPKNQTFQNLEFQV